MKERVLLIGVHIVNRSLEMAVQMHDIWWSHGNPSVFNLPPQRQLLPKHVIHGRRFFFFHPEGKAKKNTGTFRPGKST